jgi:mono/diheme cytochrome c family protein
LIYTVGVLAISLKKFWRDLMTKIKLGVISIGIVFLLIACGDTTNKNSSTTNTSQTTPTPAAKPTPDTLAEARKLFADNCVDCHKENGEGGTATIGKKVIKNIPSFKSDKVKNDADEKLIKTITNGEEAMPSFKDDLSAEQIKSLVQFIRKEFQGK